MEVEYADNMVKWLYDDKEIIYETKGVEFATDVATAIYIELMFDGIYEYRFVGFSGEDVKIVKLYAKERTLMCMNGIFFKQITDAAFAN